MIENFILVNGKRAKINPYSEGRLERLLIVQNDIDEFIDKDPDMTFDSLDRKKVAGFWKRKADVLWTFDEKVSEAFFEDKEFESGILMETEKFFLSSRIYL